MKVLLFLGEVYLSWDHLIKWCSKRMSLKLGEDRRWRCISLAIAIIFSSRENEFEMRRRQRRKLGPHWSYLLPNESLTCLLRCYIAPTEAENDAHWFQLFNLLGDKKVLKEGVLSHTGDRSIGRLSRGVVVSLTGLLFWREIWLSCRRLGEVKDSYRSWYAVSVTKLV